MTDKKNFPARGPRKKETKILPAHRQIFENYKEQGFRHLGKAIRKTGVYSDGVAARVNLITKSKSWQLLMQEYMPEEFLAQRHSELLDKRQIAKVTDKEYGDDGKLKSETVRIVDMGPETNAVSKGLELAYRLRGSFKPEGVPPASTVMYNLFYKQEVRDQVKLFEDGLKNTLLNEINKRNITEAENNAELRGDGESAGGEGSEDSGGGAPEGGGTAG